MPILLGSDALYFINNGSKEVPDVSRSTQNVMQQGWINFAIKNITLGLP